MKPNPTILDIKLLIAGMLSETIKAPSEDLVAQHPGANLAFFWRDGGRPIEEHVWDWLIREAAKTMTDVQKAFYIEHLTKALMKTEGVSEFDRHTAPFEACAQALYEALQDPRAKDPAHWSFKNPAISIDRSSHTFALFDDFSLLVDFSPYQTEEQAIAWGKNWFNARNTTKEPNVLYPFVSSMKMSTSRKKR